jgi:hypothetical protein
VGAQHPQMMPQPQPPPQSHPPPQQPPSTLMVSGMVISPFTRDNARRREVLQAVQTQGSPSLELAEICRATRTGRSMRISRHRLAALNWGGTRKQVLPGAETGIL